MEELKSYHIMSIKAPNGDIIYIYEGTSNTEANKLIRKFMKEHAQWKQLKWSPGEVYND